MSGFTRHDSPDDLPDVCRLTSDVCVATSAACCTEGAGVTHVCSERVYYGRRLEDVVRLLEREEHALPADWRQRLDAGNDSARYHYSVRYAIRDTYRGYPVASYATLDFAGWWVFRNGESMDSLLLEWSPPRRELSTRVIRENGVDVPILRVMPSELRPLIVEVIRNVIARAAMWVLARQ